MESNPVIFDISSDEEAAFDEPRGGDDDHDWLTELLQTVDKEIASSDEVIVVGEYNPPKPKSKSKSSKPVKDVEDDDCVVLDGDPDEQVDVVDDTASDGDDVLVVGQKGQVCNAYYCELDYWILNFLSRSLSVFVVVSMVQIFYSD